MTLYDLLITCNNSMTIFEIIDKYDQSIFIDSLYNITIKSEYRDIKVEAWEIDTNETGNIITVYTDCEI